MMPNAVTLHLLPVYQSHRLHQNVVETFNCNIGNNNIIIANSFLVEVEVALQKLIFVENCRLTFEPATKQQLRVLKWH